MYLCLKWEGLQGSGFLTAQQKAKNFVSRYIRPHWTPLSSTRDIWVEALCNQHQVQTCKAHEELHCFWRPFPSRSDSQGSLEHLDPSGRPQPPARRVEGCSPRLCSVSLAAVGSWLFPNLPFRVRETAVQSVWSGGLGRKEYIKRTPHTSLGATASLRGGEPGSWCPEQGGGARGDLDGPAQAVKGSAGQWSGHE